MSGLLSDVLSIITPLPISVMKKDQLPSRNCNCIAFLPLIIRCSVKYYSQSYICSLLPIQVNVTKPKPNPQKYELGIPSSNLPPGTNRRPCILFRTPKFSPNQSPLYISISLTIWIQQLDSFGLPHLLLEPLTSIHTNWFRNPSSNAQPQINRFYRFLNPGFLHRIRAESSFAVEVEFEFSMISMSWTSCLDEESL